MDPIIVLSLVAGFLAVDDRAGWQSLLAQPVFAALLVGLLTGEVQSAIVVGLMLEIVWFSILPMRGMRKPDQVTGGVVGAGTTCLLVQQTADPRFAFMVAVGVFAGFVTSEIGGRLSAPLYDLLNRRLGRVAFPSDQSREEVIRKLTALHWGSSAYIFVIQALLVFILLFLSFYVSERFTRVMDGAFVDGAIAWRALIPVLGAAAVIHFYWHHHHKRILVMAAAVVVVLLWLR